MSDTAELHAALGHVCALEGQLSELRTRLERLIWAAGTARPDDAPPLAPASEWRREHRPGREPRLAADPEQRAFVEARFDTMTFEGIAEAARERFGPERAVRRTALHTWRRKYCRSRVK